MTRISSSTFIDHPKNLILEDNVYIGHFNFIEASAGIKIEEGCQITNFISITTHSSHNSIRLYGREYTQTKNHIGYQKGGIHIGKYTFVGPHSLIMPRSHIGKGCIIAAYSYVDGVYPDFSIIKGNPAIVVGDTRVHDEELIQKYPELKSLYEQWAND